jgi:MFS family permease
VNTTTSHHSAITLPRQQSRGLLNALPAFKYRNFRLFWFGQLISLIGTWMQTTGQSWLVLQLTHNSLALGTVGALQFLPILLFTLYGGVLADKLPKRRVLLFTQSASAVVATILGVLVLTHTVQIWHIYVLAFSLGVINSIDMPTRQSFFGEMVDREAMTSAIALNSSMFNMAKVVGPGIAGLVIARFGEGPLFVGNALSFIPVLLGLALINTDKLFIHAKKTEHTDESTLSSLRTGLRYVWQTPAIFLIIAVVAVVSLFAINLNVVEPLIATDLLHQGAQGFGFISSFFGVGALFGALWVAWGNKKPSLKLMLISASCFCVALGLVGLSHWFVLTAVLAMITGFAMLAFVATANTTLQTISPEHLRGRVMGVYMLVFNGTTPFGNFLIGWLAGLIGISLTLVISALISLFATITAWFRRAPAEKDLKRALSARQA